MESPNSDEHLHTSGPREGHEKLGSKDGYPQCVFWKHLYTRDSSLVFEMVYYIRIQKGESQGEKCHVKTDVQGKKNKNSKMRAHGNRCAV